MKRVGMLQWTIGLTEIIWFKKKHVRLSLYMGIRKVRVRLCGRRLPVFYLEVTGSTALIRKAGFPSPGRPFFATKFLHLQRSNSCVATPSPSQLQGLNSFSLVRPPLLRGLNSSAAANFASPKLVSQKNRGKLQIRETWIWSVGADKSHRGGGGNNVLPSNYIWR